MPIKFAKIGLDETEKGVFSDNVGSFTLDLTNVKRSSTVKIEMIGFDNLDITVENFIEINPQNIYLERSTKQIEEITILGARLKDKNLGYNSKSKKLHIDFLSKSSMLATKRYTEEELEKPQMELAIPIQTKHKSKIAKININFSKFILDNPLPARFVIYSELNGKPNKILNEEDILVQITNNNIKENIFTVDVSNQNIWFSGKIFVSFQPLDKNFSGIIWVSAGVFGESLVRSFLENWRKLPLSLVPAINIDVKTAK